MDALVGIARSGYIEGRQRRERALDFAGVAFGVGLGTALWLILAAVARLIG